MHTPDFTRRFVRYAHYTLGKAGDAGVIAEPLRGSAITAGVEPCSNDMSPAAPFALRTACRSNGNPRFSVSNRLDPENLGFGSTPGVMNVIEYELIPGQLLEGRKSGSFRVVWQTSLFGSVHLRAALC